MAPSNYSNSQAFRNEADAMEAWAKSQPFDLDNIFGGPDAIRKAWRQSPAYKQFRVDTENRHREEAQQAQGQQAENTAMAAEQSRGTQWRDQLQAFYAEMSKPLDMKDPTVMRIQADVQGRSAMAANQRGIQGGLSNLNTEKALADSALGQQGARQQLGMQALGLGLNDTAGLERLRQQGSQFDRNFGEDQYRYNVGLSQQTHAGQQQFGQGVGSLIGGAIGLPFGLAGPGAQLGGGIGGLSGGTWSPPQRNPYSSGGYRGGN